MTGGAATPALKEWAAVISAVASGDQIIIVPANELKRRLQQVDAVVARGMAG